MEKINKKISTLFENGLAFHGHKCPAMPLGIRAGLAAMKTLGVERSQDKELRIISETGEGHAAGCFLDGLMVATGCTYGKSNIKKLYYNKMAFTLIEAKSGRAVRVSLKPEFFQKALNSPFVQERKKGVPPQNIPAEITDPQVANILHMEEERFLVIEPVRQVELASAKGEFEARPCAKCGEMTFINKLKKSQAGELCIPCAEKH